MTLVTEGYHIQSADPGIELYVRNTRPDTLTTFTAARTLLFVHGATYPSDTMFDLKIDGESWMDFIARHGYDVYSMDVRGYGRSTRPPEMQAPIHDNPPVVTTDDGVGDFGAVVDHICERRGISRLNLMGWSWGTVIAGAYAAKNPGKVERLEMYAPLWLRRIPGGLRVDGPMGAYRVVTKDAARQRWLNGVPAERSAGGRFQVLGSRHPVLRSVRHQRAGAARGRRLGRRHAGLHGAGDPHASRLAREAAGDCRGRDASSDARAEPGADVSGSTGVPANT